MCMPVHTGGVPCRAFLKFSTVVVSDAGPNSYLSPTVILMSDPKKERWAGAPELNSRMLTCCRVVS